MVEQPVEVEVLADGRLVVWSVEEARHLFNSDFYGKPLGNSKPKEDFDELLVLDPIEGVYLSEKSLITVKKGKRRMSQKQLVRVARGQLENFDKKYLV